MTARGPADLALYGLLRDVLKDAVDDVNTMPEALNRLRVTRPPALVLRCRQCRAAAGEVHVLGKEQLKVRYVQRYCPWLPGEMSRVAMMVFWFDETPSMDATCRQCRIGERVSNTRLTEALRTSKHTGVLIFG